MTTQLSLHPSFAPGSARRPSRAFTFAEVMFAVVILGIGFIMVAAMFPVAIRQTQSTVEGITGVAEAKRGMAIMRSLGVAMANYNQNYVFSAGPPPTLNAYNGLVIDQQPNPADPHENGYLHSFYQIPIGGVDHPYNFVKGDLISQVDPRFAWVPVAYQSAPWTTTAAGEYVIPDTARIYIVAVQKRDPDRPLYDATDREAGTTTFANSGDGTFKPKVVYFKLVEGEDPLPINRLGTGNVHPDTIVFTTSGGAPYDEPAAVERAFVWVADDQVTATPAFPLNYARPGRENGRYYRLGIKRDDLGLGVYELDPAYSMAIEKDPGQDGIYDSPATPSTDDRPTRLHNLPPRDYDRASHPYTNFNYSSLPGPPARGLMIGRALKNPALPYNAFSNPYVGTAQDVFALPPVTVPLRNQ